MKQKLRIVPFGDLESVGFVDVDAGFADVGTAFADVDAGFADAYHGFIADVTAAAGAVFGIEDQVGGPLPVPEGAYNRRRGQYDAAGFLEALAGAAQGQSLLLGVTGADLFLPRLNFVFGVADSSAGVAVVSLHRLRPEFYGEGLGRALLTERVAREAIHELGHLFGLAHCDEPACIMYFSNTIGDTDRKGPGLCDRCARKLAG